MTIASEIQRVQTNIASAYTALAAKGATMPTERNSANLVSTIASVSGGGGGEAFGVSVSDLLGVVDESGTCTTPSEEFYFDGSSIKKLSVSFTNKFQSNKKIAGFYIPNLTTIAVSSAFNGVCSGCANLKEVTLPAIEAFANTAFRNAFYGCTSLTSLVVPFTKISGANVCYATFSGCTNLATVTFPNLTEIGSSSSAAYGMFTGCTKLKEISFPVLATIGATSSVQTMFSNCTGLTKVSFPALTTTTDLGTSSGWMFKGCSALTEIHFRADMQSTIEALAGYANKWGADNATVYFDL